MVEKEIEVHKQILEDIAKVVYRKYEFGFEYVFYDKEGRKVAKIDENEADEVNNIFRNVKEMKIIEPSGVEALFKNSTTCIVKSFQTFVDSEPTWRRKEIICQ